MQQPRTPQKTIKDRAMRQPGADRAMHQAPTRNPWRPNWWMGQAVKGDAKRGPSSGAAAAATAILLMLASWSADAATVIGSVRDSYLNPYVTNVLITPKSTPLRVGTNGFFSRVTNIVVRSDGTFSVPLQLGDYLVNIGNDPKDTFRISVPDSTNTFNLFDLTTNKLTYTYKENPNYENRANRGQAGGYATLGPSGKVPPSQLGTGDDMESYLRRDGTWSLPAAGSALVTAVNTNQFTLEQATIAARVGIPLTNPIVKTPTITGSVAVEDEGAGVEETVTAAELARVKVVDLNVQAYPFKADPTGVQDSTGAFQAAFDAAFLQGTGNGSTGNRGGKVIIPAGNYRITDTLILYEGITVEGAGREAVLLMTYVTGAPAMKYDRGAINLSNATLKLGGFSMRNMIGAASGDGLYLDGTFGLDWWGGSSFMLHEITLYGYAGNGTSSKGNMDSLWFNVKSVACSKNGHYFDTNSFSTSSHFHLSALGCGEYGVRGSASYSTITGSEDANKFGGYRIDSGTALTLRGGAEFNLSNQVHASYVFGLTIEGGIFLSTATNTQTAILLDNCYGVTITGNDFGGGADGSPTNGISPMRFNDCNGVYVQANTLWEYWNGTNFITGNGGWLEGVNYRKTTSRTAYIHKLLESQWALKADNSTITADTFTDTASAFVLANQGNAKWRIRNAASTGAMEIFGEQAGTNFMRFNPTGSVTHLQDSVFVGKVAAGTNGAQANTLFVRGDAKVKSDATVQVSADTIGLVDVIIEMAVQGSPMWWFRAGASLWQLFSYTNYREEGFTGQAYLNSFVITINNGFNRLTAHWNSVFEKTVAIGVTTNTADALYVYGTTKLDGNASVTGSLAVGGSAVATAATVAAATNGLLRGIRTNGVSTGITNFIDLVAGSNVVLEVANGGIKINAAAGSSGPGSSPTTTLGDMIYRGDSADVRLPVGAYGQTIAAVNGVPMWVQAVVNDDFEAVGAGTVSYEGGTQATAGGAAAFFSNAPVQANRSGRSGFVHNLVYGTNGVGGTHFSRCVYTLFSYFSGNRYLDTELMWQDSTNHAILQIGLLNSTGSSNQTSGVFWERHPNEQCWIARTIGSSSMNWTSSFPVVLNEWQRLGFSGNSSSVVFYTNGLPAWTNSTASTLPTDASAQVVGWVMVNGSTASPARNAIFVDKFKYFRY